jgi:hypothetical protein
MRNALSTTGTDAALIRNVTPRPRTALDRPRTVAKKTSSLAAPTRIAADRPGIDRSRRIPAPWGDSEGKKPIFGVD